MARFSLKLSSVKKDTRYFTLEMPCFTDPMDPATYVFAPLAVSLACGDEMDYGRLFAYLFRRFGYPNHSWDDYKQLTQYVLTTPLPDMLLVVVPYCDDTTGLHFSFMVTGEVFELIRDYDRKDYLAWRERMFDWVEANDMLPEWIESGLEYINRSKQTPLTWRQAYECLSTLHFVEEEGKDPVSVGYNWQQKVTETYSEIEEPPKHYNQRSFDWREWPDDDPCKKYNQAAYEALLDLKRPVEVRDIFINAFGRVDDPGRYRVLSGAPSAGYPSGAIGNEAPVEFAKLHAVINKLGEGNAKRGLKKVLALCDSNK